MGSCSMRTMSDPWLEEAALNLRAASAMARDGRLFGLACFHSHQAAEKALKAYLIHHGRGLLRIHDIEYLVLLCVREDRRFRTLIPEGIYLNPFYIEINYPILDPVRISPRVRRRALTAARKISRFVETRLSGASR